MRIICAYASSDTPHAFSLHHCATCACVAHSSQFRGYAVGALPARGQASIREFKFAAMPEKIDEKDTKDKLIGGLKASMDYCSQAFSKMTDANMAEMIPFFGGRQMTRMGVALVVTNDLIDHYAGLSIYLRMNSLVPPTAQKKP